MIAYIPKYFSIEELAHPQIIDAIGVTNTWMRLDADALRDLDCIRASWYLKHQSGIYVNRLNLGLDSRGLRPPDDPDGSFYSGHKKGDTFDLEPVNGLIRELYNHVFRLIRAGRLRKINTLEDPVFTPGWVHAGYMNTNQKPLIIKP
ncbi:MAG: hypothetical protein AAGH46_13465 [Bacteroidota bacterium]